MDKEQVESTPKHFSSYEEAADFWETHDTTDYLDEFRTVELESELRTRHFEVELDEDVVKILQDKAKKQGVSLRYLASDLLRQQLSI